MVLETLESLELQEQISQSKESTLNTRIERAEAEAEAQYFDYLMRKRADSLEKGDWYAGKEWAGGKGGNKGMRRLRWHHPNQWTWVWRNSGDIIRRTRKFGVLQSIGSEIRDDLTARTTTTICNKWAKKLNGERIVSQKNRFKLNDCIQRIKLGNILRQTCKNRS